MTDSTSLRSLLSPASGRNVWLRVGRLLDGVQETPTERANVVYSSDSILFVGDASQMPPRNLLAAGQREPDIELPDQTLLPGLIESHAHLFLIGGEWDPVRRRAHHESSGEALLDGACARLERVLRFGVVGVRDAGDRHGVGLALSRMYREGHVDLMPYIDSPGSAINRSGRYGAYMAEPIEACGEVEECVLSRIRSGAHRIKLIPTGIIHFEEGRVRTHPQFDADLVRDFVQAAARHGMQTLAHASGDDGIDVAIQGGVDSIEHGYFVRDDQLSQMRDRDIAWVPTFAPLQIQLDERHRTGISDGAVANIERILEQHAISLMKARSLGVQVIAGSDAGSTGVCHGRGLLYEMECMEKAGMSALDVLRAATGVPSQRLAFGEPFGQIKPGYRSRFLLAADSEMKSISTLLRHPVIVFDGRVVEADTSNLVGL